MLKDLATFLADLIGGPVLYVPAVAVLVVALALWIAGLPAVFPVVALLFGVMLSAAAWSRQ